MPKVRDFFELQRIIHAKQRAILAKGRDITRQTGEEGGDEVWQFVGERGTAKSGKLGRVETGRMLASVGDEYSDTQDGGESRFGFINNAPDYTGFQEGGFQHYPDGGMVEGMHAVEDAFDNASKEFSKRIDAMMKEEW